MLAAILLYSIVKKNINILYKQTFSLYIAFLYAKHTNKEPALRRVFAREKVYEEMQEYNASLYALNSLTVLYIPNCKNFVKKEGWFGENFIVQNPLKCKI